VDARYKDDYKITEDELKYLAERVKVFHSVTEKACKAKLENFDGSGSAGALNTAD
jgi:glycerate kinase